MGTNLRLWGAVSEQCRGRCSAIQPRKRNKAVPVCVHACAFFSFFLSLFFSLTVTGVFFVSAGSQTYLEVLCSFISLSLSLSSSSLLAPACVLLRGAVMTLKHEHLKGFWRERHCLQQRRLPERGFFYFGGGI